MAVTPSSLSFNYKKGELLPPARVVNYSANDYGNNFISYEASENWVYASSLTFTSANIHISNNANNLSVGTHSATVEIFSYAEDHHEFDNQQPGFIKTSLGTVTVSVVITEAIVLTLTPDNLTFNYEFGGSTPTAQTVNITSENAWTITESTNWLSISINSGSNNGTFQVSVTPAGLSAGTHTANVTVNDGVSTKILVVSLIVSEPDTGTDYLYVTPTTLNFGYTLSGILPPTKRTELNASANWVATTNQPWVKLVTTSGTSGVGNLDIGLQNVSSLLAGNHYAIVSIAVGNIVKTININLSVYLFAQQLLEVNTLYFADDDNNIIVSSGRTDTHLYIEANASFEGTSFNFPFAIPFYNGVATKRIGLEAKKIIGSRPFVGIGGVNLFTPYLPVSLDISIKEVELFSETVTQNIALNNISIVKGTTPVDNWISDNSREMYLSRKGIVLFSFIGSKYVPANHIKITGAVNQTFTFNNAISNLYTVMIPLSSFNLKVGDQLNINVQNTNVTVIIKPEEVEQSFVFWENKWGVWDSLEFTGEFSEKSNYKSKDFIFRKNHLNTETKVLEVTDRTTFKLNTGWMFSDNEVETLRKMLKATNIYVMINNKLTKVKSTTKSLPKPKTDEENRAFDLTFEKLIR